MKAEEYCTHEKFGYFHPIQFYYSGEITDQISLPVEHDHTLEWIPTENIEEKMHVQLQGWAIKKFLDTIAQALSQDRAH